MTAIHQRTDLDSLQKEMEEALRKASINYEIWHHIRHGRTINRLVELVENGVIDWTHENPGLLTVNTVVVNVIVSVGNKKYRLVDGNHTHGALGRKFSPVLVASPMKVAQEIVADLAVIDKRFSDTQSIELIGPVEKNSAPSPCRRHPGMRQIDHWRIFQCAVSLPTLANQVFVYRKSNGAEVRLVWRDVAPATETVHA